LRRLVDDASRSPEAAAAARAFVPPLPWRLPVSVRARAKHPFFTSETCANAFIEREIALKCVVARASLAPVPLVGVARAFADDFGVARRDAGVSARRGRKTPVRATNDDIQARETSDLCAKVSRRRARRRFCPRPYPSTAAAAVDGFGIFIIPNSRRRVD